MKIVIRKDVYEEILKSLFNPGEHPRGAGGKFITKFAPDTGANGGSSLESVFGHNYKEFKGTETKAIYKLLEERKGFVQGAYYRDDLGDLDLVWGKITDPIKHTGMGLVHIFDKHPNITPDDITNIIKNGILSKTYNGYNLEYDNYILGINHGWNEKGKKLFNNNWIVTTFKKTEEENYHHSTR